MAPVQYGQLCNTATEQIAEFIERGADVFEQDEQPHSVTAPKLKYHTISVVNSM